MRPLTQLPKSAYLESLGENDDGIWLKIENHRVVNTFSLMDYMLGAINHAGWNDLLPQLISQGFKLEAVVEYFVEQLMDDQNFITSLLWYHGTNYLDYDMRKVASSPAGKRIKVEITEKLHTCKTWDDLYNVMKIWGTFPKKVNRKIKGAIKQ